MPGADGQPTLHGDLFGQCENLRAAALPSVVAATDEVLAAKAGEVTLDETVVRGGAGDISGRVVLAVTEAQPVNRSRALPFVGREEQVAVLEARWRRALSGEGQFVLISGEPGIGKSRLIEEFLERARPQGGRWMRSSARENFANTPYYMVQQMIRRAAEVRAQDPIPDQIGALRRSVDGMEIRQDETLSLLCDVLGLPPPADAPVLTFAPEQKRACLVEDLALWGVNLSRETPTILVLEDLHWADPSSLDVIAALVGATSGASLLLIASARLEFAPAWKSFSHQVQLSLSRLDATQTRRLVSGMGYGEIGADVIGEIVNRSDGVPLFAEELARLMVDHPEARKDIPATLQGSLAARLDRLGEAREIARLGAVFGREFNYAHIRGLADIPEQELNDALQALLDADLLQARGAPPDSRYRFKHALVRDNAYDALLVNRRKTLHARAAEIIQALSPGLEKEQPEVLARHWTLAGDNHKGLALWTQAAEAAYRRRAFAEAERAYREADQLVQTLPPSAERDSAELVVLVGLHRVLQIIKGYSAPETTAVSARARDLVFRTQGVVQRVREEFKQWQAEFTAGDYAAAAATIQRIEELPNDEEVRFVRSTRVAFANLQSAFYVGDFSRGEVLYHEMVPALRDRDAPHERANILNHTGIAALAAWALGRPGEARARIAWARQRAAAPEADDYEKAMALHFGAVLGLMERDWPRAEAEASQLLRLCDDKGFAYLGLLARGDLGSSRSAGAHPLNAVDVIREGLAGLDLGGAHVGDTFYRSHLARALMKLGRLDEAAAAVENALTSNPAERAFRTHGLIAKADLRAARGEDAGADYDEAIAFADEITAPGWALQATLAKARAGLASKAELAARLAALPDDTPIPDRVEAEVILNQTD
jgi:tetratricopeptide (TPR) repeat protein